MAETSHEEERPEVHEGPDFKDWAAPDHADLWKLVIEIEHCDRIIAAMRGPVPQKAGMYYDEGLRFLEASGVQLRHELGFLICQTYGIELKDQETGPFSGAGKPRAFMTGQPRDPAT